MKAGVKTPSINVSYFPFISLIFPFVSVFFPRATTYFLHVRREYWIQVTKYYSRYKNTKSWKKRTRAEIERNKIIGKKRKEENSLTILLKIMIVEIWQKQWGRVSKVEVKMAVYAVLV